MVKKITQESRTKYQKAVEKGRLLKLQLSTIDQEGSELLLSLHFCGISILRIIDIVSNNNITSDEAKRLVDESETNPYIFDFTRKLSAKMLGEHALPLHFIAFIQVFMSGNLKKPKRKPPKSYKKFLVLGHIVAIDAHDKLKPYEGGIEALAEGMGVSTASIQRIWQSRKSKDSVSSGIAFDKMVSYLEEDDREKPFGPCSQFSDENKITDFFEEFRNRYLR